MAFFTRLEEEIEETTAGRVYVIRLVLKDGTVIHKIGMTHSDRSTDRMMEILRSWFMKYRYVPYAELRLDKKTEVPALLEKHMHELLAEWKWIPDQLVDGAQEMFQHLNEEEVLDYLRNFDYHIFLEGDKPLDSETYYGIQQELKPQKEVFDILPDF